MDMEQFRHQLDDIDQQMIGLWLRRVALADEIGHYKAEQGLEVVDEERENKMWLNWLEQAGPNCDIEMLFSAVLQVSRSRQRRIIEAER